MQRHLDVGLSLSNGFHVRFVPPQPDSEPRRAHTEQPLQRCKTPYSTLQGGRLNRLPPHTDIWSSLETLEELDHSAVDRFRSLLLRPVTATRQHDRLL